MEMAIVIMKAYLMFTIVFMTIYTVRHFVFTLNRLFGEQRIYYHDIIDSDLKSVSILIPMHNEEKVAANILDQLINIDYDNGKFEIIPINDFSNDRTKDILDEYSRKYPFIKPIHRYDEKEERGKPAALNAALEKATGDIVVVFDADYLPPPGIIKNITVCFNDPEIGAVMGRVIPVNTRVSLLTQLLDLERSGGYQVDQQARYNLGLLPQYGGTVGGFRKEVVTDSGSFNTQILAEDTELTYRLALKGWKVLYANRVECYEEVPESWPVRARQLRRWSRGHNSVMFKYFFSIYKSSYFTSWQKFDATLLLFVYIIPVIQLLGLCVSIVLFLIGEMQIVSGIFFLIYIGAYNTFGNFAPFYQVGTGCLLDGMRQRLLFLPYLIFNYFFYLWYISRGFLDSIIDLFTARKIEWEKTARFRNETDMERQVTL